MAGVDRDHSQGEGAFMTKDASRLHGKSLSFWGAPKMVMGDVFKARDCEADPPDLTFSFSKHSTQDTAYLTSKHSTQDTMSTNKRFSNGSRTVPGALPLDSDEDRAMRVEDRAMRVEYSDTAAPLVAMASVTDSTSEARVVEELVSPVVRHCAPESSLVMTLRPRDKVSRQDLTHDSTSVSVYLECKEDILKIAITTTVSEQTEAGRSAGGVCATFREVGCCKSEE